jgi:predicted SAM-dependent methyltransferase
MAIQIKKYKIQGKTLDIGSLNVNGSPKNLFDNYLGIDVTRGPGVDRVIDAYKLKSVFKKNSFDVVLCLSVLEHMSNVGAILEGVRYVLKDGGYFFISVPSINFPHHDYPHDYWRFTGQAVKEFVMKDFTILSLEEKITPTNKFHIIDCLGIKK